MVKVVQHIFSLRVRVSQGTDRVRKSTLRDELLTHFYDDALTIYQVFLRGLRVSSKSSEGFWVRTPPPISTVYLPVVTLEQDAIYLPASLV